MSKTAAKVSTLESEVVRAEIPGVDPDDYVAMTVDDGRLTISAEREQRSEHKD